MECSELLYGRRFPLRVKGAVYKSYVQSAIMYGSEAWCLKESEKGILQKTERSMVRAMCGVWLNDRRRSKNLMLGFIVSRVGHMGMMLGLNHTMASLYMAKSVHWHGHVPRREDGHALRMGMVMW